MTVWVLGDQLHPDAGPLADCSPDDERVLLVESRRFARRMPYHPQKLTLVFAAMGHFRDELRDAGYEVEYRRAETFADALDAHFADHPDDLLRAMEPASYGAADRLRELVADAAGEEGRLTLLENDLFLCSPDEFDQRFPDAIPRQETFYRWMRERTGYLMEGGESTGKDGDSTEGDADSAEEPRPAGGEWNYDEDNRQFPDPEYEFPDPPAFDATETTEAVADWVRDEFETWGDDAILDVGDADPTDAARTDLTDFADGEREEDAERETRFRWPVTREQALTALDRFVAERLPEFGPYQDAMLARSWSGNHALLSPALNLGLLRPEEVIERAIAAYEADEAPIESVEGFVRQVLGWREFVRHAYRRRMPAMGEANHLDATRDLPPLYYDGETDMHCLETVVGRVWDRGYSHHIERLMILSNFALTYGADPHELNRWFHFGYVDAYHWVTTPNVVGMGTFATDALSTKPYAASANYVEKMSDFCETCRYDPDETTGKDACPFNALYWDFLAENDETLRDNHRMGLTYHNLDRKDDDELDAVRERAAEVRELAADGDL
ncbi:cryptochrome/photolyase family protein [Halorussus salinus]|uniref:cryptochrome/photolyase family protein n=1 Tax=Halorussus salinus TaxID=1364935 RepID=UPI0010923119|nr:cryptochrome/photolyase family protein [Halorussus salinus]